MSTSDFGIFESVRENIDILDVVVPYCHIVADQLYEASEPAHRIVSIIKDRDLHFSRAYFVFCSLETFALIQQGEA